MPLGQLAAGALPFWRLTRIKQLLEGHTEELAGSKTCVNTGCLCREDGCSSALVRGNLFHSQSCQRCTMSERLQAGTGGLVIRKLGGYLVQHERRKSFCFISSGQPAFLVLLMRNMQTPPKLVILQDSALINRGALAELLGRQAAGLPSQAARGVNWFAKDGLGEGSAATELSPKHLTVSSPPLELPQVESLCSWSPTAPPVRTACVNKSVCFSPQLASRDTRSHQRIKPQFPRGSAEACTQATSQADLDLN